MGTTMRRHLRGFGGLLTVAMLALAAATHPIVTAAQESGEAPFQLTDLDGVQAAVSRTFIIDFLATSADATPTPASSGVQLFALSGTILQFDSDDGARTAYATMLDEVARGSQSETPEALTYEPVDLGGDLGDERVAFNIAGDESTIGTGSLVAIFVRDGSLIYLITGIADSGDPSDAVVAFAISVIATDAGSDEATFNVDGTSTGGLWDKFPAADDPLVAGLPSVVDSDPMDPESGM